MARWHRLAHAAAIAAREDPSGVEHELIAELAAAFAGRPTLSELLQTLEDSFSQQSWETICAFRSGLESFRDLLEPHVTLVDIDTARLETRMLGANRFVPVEVPAGTPAHHWWWFGPLPEYTLRMNESMRLLLPQWHVVEPSPLFRRTIAQGFVTVHDRLLFRRELAPRDFTDDATHDECDHNELSIHAYLEPDPSRRPVDLAAASLAFARHLAFELCRRSFASCRIIGMQSRMGRGSTLRFHVIRPGEDWLLSNLEAYDAGVLVLDT